MRPLSKFAVLVFWEALRELEKGAGAMSIEIAREKVEAMILRAIRVYEPGRTGASLAAAMPTPTYSGVEIAPALDRRPVSDAAF